MKDWCSSAVDILIGIAAALVVAFLVLMLTGCSSQPIKQRSSTPPVKQEGIAFNSVISNEHYGNSMLPTLKPGDPIAIDRYYPFSDLQEGDIVVYQHGGMPTVHRLVQRLGSHWMTQGDNNTLPDSLVLTETQYIGKVVAYGRVLK
ncbi:MAG: signal peptidase I [Verrucomicrobiota bacterium]